jgi:hypothetical protein
MSEHQYGKLESVQVAGENNSVSKNETSRQIPAKRASRGTRRAALRFFAIPSYTA